MKKFGSLLFFFGVASIILNFVNAVPRLMAWIYNWGETTAWGIKIAFVVVGAILWFIGSKNEEEEVNPSEEKNAE